MSITQILAVSGHQHFYKARIRKFFHPGTTLYREGFMRKHSLWELNSLFFFTILQGSHSNIQPVMRNREFEAGTWTNRGIGLTVRKKWAPISPGSILELFWVPQHHQDKNYGLTWKIHSLGHNYISGKVFFPAPLLTQQTVGNKGLQLFLGIPLALNTYWGRYFCDCVEKLFLCTVTDLWWSPKLRTWPCSPSAPFPSLPHTLGCFCP